MCLITKKKKARTLKRDLTVWKLMHGLTSPYQDFRYIKGETYKTKITFLDKTQEQWKCFNSEVRTGLNKEFPNWDDKRDKNTWELSREKVMTEEGLRVREGMLCIEKGFHSIVTKKEAEKYRGLSWSHKDIVKFVIPKGSQYYKDSYGCIVSNQIHLPK